MQTSVDVMVWSDMTKQWNSVPVTTCKGERLLVSGWIGSQIRRRDERQMHREGTAVPLLAGHFEAPTMVRDDLFDHVEANTESARLL